MAAGATAAGAGWQRYGQGDQLQLGRWAALTHYLDDGTVPVDNNWVENRVRPVALGGANWLFAGSLRAGQRAAAIMSLLQSAKMNGHDVFAYMKDVLERMPTWTNSRIDELLPHRWRPAAEPHHHRPSRWNDRALTLLFQAAHAVLLNFSAKPAGAM